MKDLNEKTKTFAMLDDGTFNVYILTNDFTLTFDNLNVARDKGWLVDTGQEIVSPYLPIGVLTKNDSPWIKPNRQLDMKKVMKFKRLK